jgi:hypothetical protein
MTTLAAHGTMTAILTRVRPGKGLLRKVGEQQGQDDGHRHDDDDPDEGVEQDPRAGSGRRRPWRSCRNPTPSTFVPAWLIRRVEV